MPTDAEGDAAPARLALAPVAPNPVRTSARVGYSVATAGPATLDVFNTLGQRVAVLAGGEHTPGAHSVVFDASGLASGVYVLRLRSADETVTRRIVRL